VRICFFRAIRAVGQKACSGKVPFLTCTHQGRNRSGKTRPKSARGCKAKYDIIQIIRRQAQKLVLPFCVILPTNGESQIHLSADFEPRLREPILLRSERSRGISPGSSQLSFFAAGVVKESHVKSCRSQRSPRGTVPYCRLQRIEGVIPYRATISSSPSPAAFD
jgi:hypothetical protein